MSPRAAQTCEICKEVVSKYKCPCCLVPYCSIACYKKHKENPCSKPSSTKETPVRVEGTRHVVEKTQQKASAASIANDIQGVRRPLHVEEAEYVLEKEQLEAIASSSEIQETLKDEAIQKLISNIDSSSNPSLALDEAMGGEEFRSFADKILSNISKKVNEEQ